MHYGAGALFSAGLLKSINASAYRACVHSQYTSGAPAMSLSCCGQKQADLLPHQACAACDLTCAHVCCWAKQTGLILTPSQMHAAKHSHADDAAALAPAAGR